MKIKNIIFFLFTFGMITAASAQVYQGVAGIQYSMGATTGESKNYVSDFSFRGFGMEYSKFVNRQLSVGFMIGWNIFDELRRETSIEIPGSTISGTQIRYFNAFPILANFSYFLGQPRSNVRPFASLGVGTYYILERLEVGLYQIEKDNWHLGLSPAIGILFPTDYVFLQASVRYNYAFAGNESISKDPLDISYLTFNLGITVPTW